MLEEHYRQQYEQLLKSLECHVEIPAEWQDDYFREQGPAATRWEEQRRFVRHCLRTKAVLEVAPSLPAIPRQPAFYAVFTRDLSRGGIGFLHADQLFPGERCRLWLPTQCLPFLITHCRRLNGRCYLIGAKAERHDSPEARQQERRHRLQQRFRRGSSSGSASG